MGPRSKKVQRILQGAAATLRYTPMDSDGGPAPAGADTTVTVLRADGTALVPETATGGTATERTLALTEAQTGLLDHLSAVWTDGAKVGQTSIEVVGGYYFSAGEARSTDASMEDPGKVVHDDLLAARQEVEVEFERICEVAFVPRFARVTLPARSPLVLPHKRIRRLRSVVSDGVALSAEAVAGLTYEAGIVPYHGGQVTVEYEHGYDAPPADVRRAAITRLRHRVFASRSGIPDRATSFALSEGGTFALSTPGKHRTGVPDIDAVLERYAERDLVVA